MNAMRSSPVHRRPTARRPVWGIVGAVVLGTVLLVLVALGLVWWLGSSGDTEAEAGPTPLPCTTTMVTPVETLPAAESVVLNVFNSTERSGLAAQTADTLRASGYTVKKVGNAKGEVAGVGELRFGVKGELAAQRMQYLLPGATLVPIDRDTKRVDVVLGAQFTGLVDEAVAVATMASPSPSLSGPGCVTPTPTATAMPSAVASTGPSASPSATSIG